MAYLREGPLESHICGGRYPSGFLREKELKGFKRGETLSKVKFGVIRTRPVRTVKRIN